VKENAFVLFLKYPKPGGMKTRLAAALGDDLTCGLYQCFLADLSALMHRVNAQTVIVYSGPADASFSGFPGVPCILQRGGDIGERMFFALQDVFAQGFERAVLIGSDIPDLPAFMINDAFEILRSADVVLGPSTDGGYYLVGCTRESLRRSVFFDMVWSSHRVFSETLKRIAEVGLTSAALQPWSDIDDFDDLISYYERNAKKSATSHVVHFIKTRGIVPDL
jgi:hypothetical protein